MWIIKKVGYLSSSGEMQYLHSCVTTEYANQFTQLVIHVSETETGDYKVFHGRDKECIEFVKAHNPYGHVTIGGVDVKPAREAFCAISDLDLSLMESIESVGLILLDAHDTTRHPDLSFLRSCPKNRFRALDNLRTLYLGQIENVGIDFPCTLFDIMCHERGWWERDTYYVYQGYTATMQIFDGEGDMIVANRVKFKDVSRARALIAKSAVMGIDAIQDFIVRG